MAATYPTSPSEAIPALRTNNAVHEVSSVAKYSENQIGTKRDVATKTDHSESLLSKTANQEQNNVIAEGLNENVIEYDEEIRKDVWSDVDDELYIAQLIASRSSNEDYREKRDTSAYVSDSYKTHKVVSSDKLDKYEDMWDLEPTDLTDCDCMGPPPQFLLPPPPRPPFLQAEYYCGDDPIPDLETCNSEPVSKLKLLTDLA